jgi:hypothetical protein
MLTRNKNYILESLSIQKKNIYHVRNERKTEVYSVA